MKEKNNHIIVLDLLKFFSISLVFLSHFFYFYKDTFYNVGLYANIMKIINGKFGVSVLAIISGYLSYKKGISKKESIIVYTLKRYVYFVICDFIICSIYYFVNYKGCREIMSFGFVIGESLKLSDNIFSTYWFAVPFFVGNIFAFMIGKYDISLYETIIICFVFIYLKQTFLATCILGTLINSINKKATIELLI